LASPSRHFPLSAVFVAFVAPLLLPPPKHRLLPGVPSLSAQPGRPSFPRMCAVTSLFLEGPDLYTLPPPLRAESFFHFGSWELSFTFSPCSRMILFLLCVPHGFFGMARFGQSALSNVRFLCPRVSFDVTNPSPASVPRVPCAALPRQNHFPDLFPLFRSSSSSLLPWGFVDDPTILFYPPTPCGELGVPKRNGWLWSFERLVFSVWT